MQGLIFVVIGLIALALIIPILLDESPSAYIENGLCTIFAGGGNTTCGSVLDDVTFIAESPIIITPNFTENTITWSFLIDTNATNQTNIHVSLGGANVFKNETGGEPNIVYFRGLAEGAGINITERENTILIEADIAQSLCQINVFIGFLFQGLFDCDVEGDTVNFVGLNGISLGNSSSLTWSLNATLNNLNDVNITNVDENHILIYNITSGQFENEPIPSVTSLTDVHFNAEEATVDDLTGLDCVNDVTISYFDPALIDEYRRQAVEFCPDSDTDDNLTWLYVVPNEYQAEDFKFRLFWSDEGSGAGSYTQSTVSGTDSEEDSTDNEVSLTNPDLEMHDGSPTFFDGYVAMRYTSVPIPQGSTITNAQIQFHVDEVGSSTVTNTFRGEDVDNSGVLTTTTGDISNRTETTASVNWVIPSWPTVSAEGADQLTPDLSSIVQEIVDRGGWSSGNALTIMIKAWPDNSGFRVAESADGEPASSPELTIDWVVAGGDDPPVCWEFSLMAIADTEVVDGNFIARDTQCTNRSGTDKLSITEFTVIEADHGFTQEDLVYLRIHRPDNFVADDFESDAYVLGGELQWLN